VLAGSRFLIYPETSGSPGIFFFVWQAKTNRKKDYLFIG
jgi:hypothetical protein